MLRIYGLIIILGCLLVVTGVLVANAARENKLVPPPPVTINLNMRMTTLECKIDAIAGMVKFLYRRQIVDDASSGKKNNLVPDIKLWASH